MAINPGIALGVQPAQPLDMLGAYGKAMTIKNLVDGAKLQQLQSESLGQKMRFDQQDQAFDLAKKKIGLFQQTAAGFESLPPEQRAAQYPMWRAEMSSLLGDQNIPEQYDPAYMGRLATSGMDPKASYEAAQALAQRAAYMEAQRGVQQPRGMSSAVPGTTGSAGVEMNEDGTASLSAPQVNVRDDVSRMPNPNQMFSLYQLIQQDRRIAGTPIAQQVLENALKLKQEQEQSPSRGMQLIKGEDGQTYVVKNGMREDVIPTGNDPNAQFWRGPEGQPVPNQARIDADLAKARAGATTVSVNTKEQDESAKIIGKGYGEQYTELQKAEFASRKRIGRAERLESLLDGVQTGKLTPMGTQLAGYAHALGFEIDPKLGNKEAAIALESEMALELRNPSGGAGMPGAMSDADRTFLQNMASFSNKTPQGRKFMLESYRAIAKRDADIARLARDYKKRNGGKFDEGFYDELAVWSERNPMFPSAAAIEAEKARRGLK